MHAVGTVPLFDMTAAPDGWHRVQVPGGFEAWIFEAVESGFDRRVVAGIFDGYPFHPRYRRLARRFLLRPTRNSPPLPAEFPCVSICVQEAERSNDELVFQFPPGSLVGKSNSLDVQLGPNHARREPTGGVIMHIEHMDSIRCDIAIDVANREARVALARKGLADLVFCGEGRFRHVVQTTPGKLEIDGVALSGFRRRRFILCS